MSEVTIAVTETVSPYHSELVKYNEVATDQKLREIAEQASKIKIIGENDKDGYQSAVMAKTSLKKFLAAIEKKRKAIKQKSLDEGRAIDEKAEFLSLILQPELLRLTREIDEVDLAEQRRQDAIRQEQEIKAVARINELAQIGYLMSMEDATVMSEEAFQIIKKSAHDTFLLAQAEEQRKKEEQAAKDQELETLRAKLAAMETPKQVPNEDQIKQYPLTEAEAFGSLKKAVETVQAYSQEEIDALTIYANAMKAYAERIRNSKYPLIVGDKFEHHNEATKMMLNELANNITSRTAVLEQSIK